MSKAYTSAKKGQVHGTLVSPEVFPSPHSPEEEKKLQKLVSQLRPLLMQSIQQNIEVNLEEFWDIHEGDVREIVIKYITNYIDRRTFGLEYKDGPGIDGSALGSGTIKVEIGDTPQGLKFDDTNNKELQVNYDQGLELDSGQLEVKCSKAIEKDGNGVYVDLHSSIQTTYEASGCGLEIDPDNASGKLRVVPTHFLLTADD
jgi:hypothetical protein